MAVGDQRFRVSAIPRNARTAIVASFFAAAALCAKAMNASSATGSKMKRLGMV